MLPNKVLAVGLLGGCLATWAASHVISPINESIRARRIVLDDANGVARITMEVGKDDSPSIAIRNAKGRKVAEMSALENSARILLWGRDQQIADLALGSGTGTAILVRETTGFSLAIGEEESDTIPASPTDPRRWGVFIHKGGLSGDKAGIGAIVDGASGHSRGFFYVNPRSE
jgi:hypothetical protein